MRKPHTNFQPGKRLLIILRGGEQFIDRFVDRNDRFIVLAGYGRLPVRHIRAIQFPKSGRHA